MTSIPVIHYSDVLCVWAYVSEVRLFELRARLGDRTVLTRRFCSLFGDTATKIGGGWRDRGGFEGYAEHVRGVAARFGHVTVHPDAWTRTRPATSMTPHALVKAAELACRDGLCAQGPVEAFEGRTVVEELAWRLRVAFFRDARDIARYDVAAEVAADLELPVAALRARLDDGTAWAALSADLDLAAADAVRGSPTYVLNERRQVLYGNVGYKVIEANVMELLHEPGDRASWC